MNELPAHEIGVILLSASFAVALVAGGIAGKLGGLYVGAGVGALAVSAMSLAAAWITWQAGPQPDQGKVRVEGRAAEAKQDADSWIPRTEPLERDAFVIRYSDAAGTVHELSGSYAPRPMRIGEAIAIDYAAANPGQAQIADLGFHRTILMVFLLFGTLPLLMGLAFLVSAWEDRPGANHAPRVRAPAVLKACTAARVLANLTLIAGFVVTFRHDGIASITLGFPVIGAGAAAHAVIGIAAGIRASAVLTYLVIGVGFIGFGLFARAAS